MHLIQTFRANVRWVCCDANRRLHQNSFFPSKCMLCIFAQRVHCCICWFPSSHVRSSIFALLISLPGSLTDTGVRFSLTPLPFWRSAWQPVPSVSDPFCLCTSLPALFYETLHLSQALALPRRYGGVRNPSKIREDGAKSSVQEWTSCTFFHHSLAPWQSLPFPSLTWRQAKDFFLEEGGQFVLTCLDSPSSAWYHLFWVVIECHQFLNSPRRSCAPCLISPSWEGFNEANNYRKRIRCNQPACYPQVPG